MNRLTDKHHWTIARLAYWYLDRGRAREAERLTRGLIALDGRDGLAWQYYGEARRQQDDLEGAVSAFEEAAKIRERSAQVWMKLGAGLLRLRRRDEALRALKRAKACVEDDRRLRRRIDALLHMCRR